MNIQQQTAFEWLEKGISSIPIHFHGKIPDSRALIRAGLSELKNGKLKGKWEALQDRLPTEHEVKCMFASSLVNIAIVTGWSGLVVLDFDEWPAFLNWYAKYQIQTYMVQTSRGVHVYLKSAVKTACRKGIGIDVKASGGYVLVPPSIHPSRKEYQVIWDAPIAQVDSVEDYLPAELFPPAEQVSPVTQTQYMGGAPIYTNNDPWAAAQGAGFASGRDLISEIRSRVSILDYLPGAVQKSGDGRWWVTCCPFHDDHHPSFWIDTARQICGCYAGCNGGKPFDVINLVAALKGISNRDAIFLLGKVM